MGKLFEDYLGEIQIDMIDVCFEYSKYKASKVYLYCSYENEVYSIGYFYKIKGKVIERHVINQEIKEANVSNDVQIQVMDILFKDLKSIKELCLKYKEPIPTEIKLTYEAKSDSLEAKYKFYPVYSMYLNKCANDVEQEWIEEIKKQK